jgi:type IV pilus assembly protein PilC
VPHESGLEASGDLSSKGSRFVKYRYRARKADGSVVTGVREASAEDLVVAWLREQGLFPIRLQVQREKTSNDHPERGDSMGPFSSWSLLHGRVRLKEKTVLFRQLATMIDAGITLVGALDVLVQQTQNRRLAAAMAEIREKVKGGVAMSAAMSRNPSIFSPLVVALVRAGEEGGILDQSLERIATFQERQDMLRRKVVSAVSYPAVVILFSIFVLYLLVTVVVPKFSGVFANLGVPLPPLTRVIFACSAWMRDFWYAPPLLLGVVAGAVYACGRIDRLKSPRDRAKLKIPVFGDLLYKSILARSFRTFGTLLTAGVPMLSCLEMTGEVAENAVVHDAFRRLRDNAQRGIALNVTAKQGRLFPPMVSHMIAVGEETGRLEGMLGKVADWYESELEEKVKQLTSVLEPLLIIFVGGIVAVVALAIFMPIVGAIQSLM